MKYPRIRRIPTTDWEVRHMYDLSDYEVEVLLSAPVYVEEKLDGKITQMTIWEGQGLKLPCRELVLFGEDLHWVHTVEYDSIPMLSSYIIYFDIYDGYNKVWYPPEARNPILRDHGLIPPPLIYTGNVSIAGLLSMMDRRSEFGSSKIEGIVIKRYDGDRLIAGKIINPEFEGRMGRWLRRPRRMNSNVGN